MTRVASLGGILFCSLLLVFCQQLDTLAQQTNARVNGLGITQSSPFDLQSFDESILNMVQVGANAVALDVTWQQPAFDASGLALDSGTSVLESLGPIVDAIHERGLDVFLRSKIQLPLGDTTAAISPTDPDRWFDSYGQSMQHVAEFANARNIAMVSIGSNLNSLEAPEFSDHWSTLIGEVRTKYAGDLTYSASFDFDHNFGGGFTEVPWWDELDVIGIDARYPLTQDFNAVPDALLESARFIADDIESWLNSTEIQRDVLFSRIGYQSVDGGATARTFDEKNNIDLTEQASAYDATLTAMGERAWWRGGFWSGWSTEPHAGGAGDDGLTPQHKPAEAILAKHFGGIETFIIRNPLLESWEEGFNAWHLPDSPPSETGDLQLIPTESTHGEVSLSIPSSGGYDLSAAKIWTLEGSEAYTLFQIASSQPEVYVLEFDATFDLDEVAGGRSEMIVALTDDSNRESVVAVGVRHSGMEGRETSRVSIPLTGFEQLAPESLFYELELGTDNSWEGSISIDNLRLRSTISGDVTNDGVIDHNDIDALSDIVRHGAFEQQADLNGDGRVNDVDRFFWAIAAETLPGDFDLSGSVGFDDFLTLSENFGRPGNWLHGDADGDRKIDFPDFLALSRNFGEMGLSEESLQPMNSPTVANVPEPGFGFWLVTLLFCPASCRTSRRRRRR